MTDASRRLVGATCFLAALWVLVYWLWQPGRPAVSFARGSEPAQGQDQSPDRPGPESDTPAQPAGPVRDPLDDQPAPPPPTPLPAGPSLVETMPTVPTFREYTIRENDTFESIAARELGSRSLHEAIARANPLKDPRRLRVGDVIRLPLDPANVQGGPAGEGPVVPVREAVSQGPVTYTVEPGDSLSKISQLFYGTVRYADLIYQANRDVLRSVNDVRTGQVIRIPPKPE